jgi:hypothetical protein
MEETREPRWRQWTEEQARAALDELSRTGVSVRSFAQSKGVSTQRIVYWKKRLAQSGTPKFVAVPLPSVSRPSRPAQIEIVVGNIAVRVREDLDVQQLARIVDALAGRTA